mmetsp:Transcript_5425/g.12441  ORF Transcript_5425/g.12441 Transcript_5425/m.12441 type:complete len:89 (+) Transcript_5425:2033-2299(+)
MDRKSSKTYWMERSLVWNWDWQSIPMATFFGFRIRMGKKKMFVYFDSTRVGCDFMGACLPNYIFVPSFNPNCNWSHSMRFPHDVVSTL